MAACGSRLEAVLRAGQARLAATGVAPHAKAFWRLSPAQEAARQAQVQAQQAAAAEREGIDKSGSPPSKCV